MLKSKYWLIALFSSAALYAANNCEIISRSFVAKYLGRVSESEWEKRGCHGEIITVYSDGVTLTESFLEGRLQGKTVRSFPHSDKTAQMKVFEEGLLKKQVDYYPSGLMKQEQLFNGAQLDTRTTTLYREDGTMLSIETVQGSGIIDGQYFDQKGKVISTVKNRTGLRTFVDEAGKVLRKEAIASGHLAERTTYYSNGSLKCRLPFKNNHIEGSVQYYLASGAPARIEHWVAGKQNGLTLVFENGEKSREIPYVDGKKEGVERHYKNETTIAEEISWNSGVRHGPSSVFVSGVTHTQWYFEGKRVNQVTFELLDLTKQKKS